jgi:hypothetical protein
MLLIDIAPHILNDKTNWEGVDSFFRDSISLKEPMSRYLALARHEEKLNSHSTLTVYYNRVYWFNELIKAFVRTQGRADAGLDQQLFKLLENGEHYPDIDWAIVEEIVKPVT